MKDERFSDQLIPLDPQLEIKKKDIKKELESKFDSYRGDILQKAQTIFYDQKEEQGEVLKYVYKQLENKFTSKQNLEDYDIQLRDIQTSLSQKREEDQ